ncbi:MAG: hypothetical protein ABIJ42_08130 [Acidobacteriota bacterium]
MKRICLILPLFVLFSPFILATDNSDVIGTWKCETQTEKIVEFTLTLFEKDGRLFGKYNTEHLEMILHYIRILNDELLFQTEIKGLKIKYRTTVEGNKIQGTLNTEDLTVKFAGVREEPPQQ